MMRFFGYGSGIRASAAGLIATGAMPTLAGTTNNIVFSSVSATPVPTIGGAALLLTAGLISLLALKQYRHRGGVSPMLAGLIGTAIVAASGGMQIITDARALPGTLIPGPGPLDIIDGPNVYFNDAGEPLEVSDINVDQGCSIATNTTGETECTLGSVVEEQGICGLVLSCGR